MGYPLLALHTVSLSYLSGTVAIHTDTTIILCAFIITFAITMLMALMAGKMVHMFFKKGAGGAKANSLGPTVGILGTIVVIVSIIAIVIPDKFGTKSSAFLGLSMMLIFIYFLFDTYAIVNGKYKKIVSQEDYIYGSVKLFSDFVLCFSLILAMCQADPA